MLAQRGLEVLGLREMQVLPPGVPENITEQVAPPPALFREVDLVDRVVHLGLNPRAGLETQHGLATRLRPEPMHQVLDDCVPTHESPSTQLLVDAHGGDRRPAGEEFLNEGHVLVEDAAPWFRRRRQVGMDAPLAPSVLMVWEASPHPVSGNPQLLRYPPHGRPLLPTPDDFLLKGSVIHGRSISGNRSCVGSATTCASRPNLRQLAKPTPSEVSEVRTPAIAVRKLTTRPRPPSR